MPPAFPPDVYSPPDGRQPSPQALYIHVPFCLHRCGYCDFTLVARKDELVPSYLRALKNELSRIEECHDVDTIFIGGGTPTHLSAEQLTELFDIVTHSFRLADHGEFSVEANPDGLGDDRLEVLVAAGVNRLSLGVQSFNNQTLTTLERQHTADIAAEVIDRAAGRFASVSLDLIFGVPGQSLAEWRDTLVAATECPVNHISTYGLTFEKGTDFYQRLQRGNIAAAPNDLERDMYALAMERLVASGFEHYEISNFAATNHRCRHNLTYWNAREYFAFGPGAARYVNGIRSTNARSVTRWIKSWLDGKVALQDWEQLSDAERIREAIFLGLRMTDGISLAEFEARFGCSPSTVEPEAVDHNIQKGWLEIGNGQMCLTQEGRFMADTVVSEFL